MVDDVAAGVDCCDFITVSRTTKTAAAAVPYDDVWCSCFPATAPATTASTEESTEEAIFIILVFKKEKNSKILSDDKMQLLLSTSVKNKSFGTTFFQSTEQQ